MESVKDVLNHKGRDAWTIGADEEVSLALAIMKDKNIGALLVLDDDKSLSGIFTERDFVRYCSGKDHVSLKTTLRKVMNRDVICVNEYHMLESCMVLMTEKRIRHLPVLKDENIVGMISIGDIVNARINDKNILIDQLEHYIGGSLY